MQTMLQFPCLARKCAHVNFIYNALTQKTLIRFYLNLSFDQLEKVDVFKDDLLKFTFVSIVFPF